MHYELYTIRIVSLFFVKIFNSYVVDEITIIIKGVNKFEYLNKIYSHPKKKVKLDVHVNHLCGGKVGEVYKRLLNN